MAHGDRPRLDLCLQRHLDYRRSQVAKELGVRYVVQGSVRKAGKRVRISVQLNDASHGAHVWAERYDRDLDDIFALEDEISRAIVANIDSELQGAERDLAHRKPPENKNRLGSLPTRPLALLPLHPGRRLEKARRALAEEALKPRRPSSGRPTLFMSYMEHPA